MSGVSIEELERRWRAVRQAMTENKYDYLIAQSSIAIFDGNVRWFTDISVEDGYTATVIVPHDEEMTTIMHGPTGEEIPSTSERKRTGVKKQITVPMLPVLANGLLNAERVVAELAPIRNPRIGFVGMNCMSTSFYKHVTGHLTSATFEDATDMVDSLKAVKSEEELNLIRGTCELQDALFADILPFIAPGKSVSDVAAAIVRRSIELGGDKTNIIIWTAPSGSGAATRAPKVLGDGDQAFLLLETNGPGGFWGELGKTVCLGRIPSELEENFALAQHAQEVTLDLLKPGADTADIWEANNTFLLEHGMAEERRIYAHSQGYDMVERPAIDPIEEMKIKANMNIVVHPEARSPKARGWVCENFVVKADGQKERLHKTPQKIYVV
jgi:Xaa-Pro aminopeptidase